MHNAVQWLYLTLLVVAITAPTVAVTIGRPWLKPPRQAGQALYVGLAVAIAFLGAAVFGMMILGSSGDLRYSKAWTLEVALEALGRALGPEWWMLPTLLVGATLVAVVAVARALRPPTSFPADPRPEDVRRLIRKGADAGDMRAFYAQHPMQINGAALDEAIALGNTDIAAQQLVYRSLSYRRVGGPPFALFDTITDLSHAVYGATTLQEATQPLAELRSIVARLDAGELFRA